MAVRIHQLLAVISGLNTETDAAGARLGQVAGTPDLFSGMEKTSRAASESADPKAPRRRVTPPKITKVRCTAVQVLSDAQKLLSRKWDTALTLDTAQGAAKADVTVDGVTVMADVPVRHLVYLEGELAKLQQIVAALPVLDGVQDWTDENTPPGQWRTRAPREGELKEKIPGRFVLYEATKEHPAQVQRLDTDEVVEYTSTVNYSGALPAPRKSALLERLSDLRTAVKMAREEANSAVVTSRSEGAEIFTWLLRP